VPRLGFEMECEAGHRRLLPPSVVAQQLSTDTDSIDTARLSAPRAVGLAMGSVRTNICLPVGSPSLFLAPPAPSSLPFNFLLRRHFVRLCLSCMPCVKLIGPSVCLSVCVCVCIAPADLCVVGVRVLGIFASVLRGHAPGCGAQPPECRGGHDTGSSKRLQPCHSLETGVAN
jgi:hypothetical protein